MMQLLSDMDGILPGFLSIVPVVQSSLLNILLRVQRVAFHHNEIREFTLKGLS